MAEEPTRDDTGPESGEAAGERQTGEKKAGGKKAAKKTAKKGAKKKTAKKGAKKKAAKKGAKKKAAKKTARKKGAGKKAAKKKRAPTEEEIRRRAHEIYRERGGEHGADEEDWYRAERELAEEAEREESEGS